MEGSLAALALNPQVTVLLFVALELLFAFDVDVLNSSRAVITDDLLAWLEKIFAPKAGLLNFCELE